MGDIQIQRLLIIAILSANCTLNMILAHPPLLAVPNVGISLVSLFGAASLVTRTTRLLLFAAAAAEHITRSTKELLMQCSAALKLASGDVAGDRLTARLCDLMRLVLMAADFCCCRIL